MTSDRDQALLTGSLAFLFSLVTPCVVTAELPTAETVIAAFRERKAETKYIRYRAAGEAVIPANSRPGINDETYIPTGEVFPPADLKFKWASAAEFELLTHRGVYEIQTTQFNISEEKFNEAYERLYFESPRGDIEYLLPPKPQASDQPPRPPIRFTVNQERRSGGYSSHFYGQAIEAAFGYFPKSDAEYFPIDDPNWLVTSIAKVTAGPSPDLINLTFADGGVSGPVIIYNLQCESSGPYRLLRFDRDDGRDTTPKFGVTYQGDSLRIKSMTVEYVDFDTQKVSLKGHATLTDFETLSSVPKFVARAKPSVGDWIRDSSTRSTYQIDSQK